jgi:hypothetical protein
MPTNYTTLFQTLILDPYGKALLWKRSQNKGEDEAVAKFGPHFGIVTTSMGFTHSKALRQTLL